MTCSHIYNSNYQIKSGILTSQYGNGTSYVLSEINIFSNKLIDKIEVTVTHDSNWSASNYESRLDFKAWEFSCVNSSGSDVDGGSGSGGGDSSLVSCDGSEFTSVVFPEYVWFDSQDTNADGDNFETIGAQEWTVENACHKTYSDGTPIPEVTDFLEWANLTTGAWCYFDNDPSKGVLYNWYAIAGIHDTDPNTPNKTFAPDGWHVPSHSEWLKLEIYLVNNGYNFDGTTNTYGPFCSTNSSGNWACNKISKAMASTTGWVESDYFGDTGWSQVSNNSSGFNAFPVGRRNSSGFYSEGVNTGFWSSTSVTGQQSGYARFRSISSGDNYLRRDISLKGSGESVRLIKN